MGGVFSKTRITEELEVDSPFWTVHLQWGYILDLV